MTKGKEEINSLKFFDKSATQKLGNKVNQGGIKEPYKNQYASIQRNFACGTIQGDYEREVK